MPTAMTFTSLQADVRSYCERGGSAVDTQFNTQLPGFINLRERQIARELKIQGFINNVNTAYTASVLEVKVLVTHISRYDPRIIFADKGSREFDLQDFSLDFDSFLTVNSFGPFQIDCFASVWNKKCEFYFSKFLEPTALGTDFFCTNSPRECKFVCFPASCFNCSGYLSFV